jgi:hypothetical protein
MEKEFTPYQEALELKELGFDEPCFGYYEDNNLTITFPSTSSNGWKWVGNSIIPAKNTNAPLFQQAFRWFREKFDLRIWIESNYGVAKFEYVIATTNPNFLNKQFNDFSGYNTHEEAELECLKKLIQIVKENKQ